jgi:hypothetical protein
MKAPELIIARAMEIAYDEDSNQVVGIIDGNWVIRDQEDPASDTLENSVVVDSMGVIE